MATVNMDVMPTTDAREDERTESSSTAEAGDARDRSPASDNGSNNGDASCGDDMSHGGEAVAEDSAAADSTAVAFDAVSLAGRHQAEIWRYLRFLGCDDAQADDVTQETFLAVLKRPPDVRDVPAVRSYLRTVARNAFLTLLRKTSREAEFDLEVAEQVWAEAHPRDGGDERLAALDDCLAALEGRARQAIDLTYKESRSRAEIAAALDITEDGVKSLLRRTRDVLRQCVERKLNAGGG